jgi:hypothetical protein
MTEDFEPDQFVEDDETFEYQAGVWTRMGGMRLSLKDSQAMTMRFYELHGRSPIIEPKPKAAPRANSKKAKVKAAAVRDAIAKALAAKAGK